ncbi:hypothetical protein L596_029614 [Steinernema carpocapsae]|uniref:Uncharacterized protein n=1 Tax=Steinernema carpocapsae TaxID=34508 RepID=A0A4U5LV63_STECR|nr:hypothetical protein L596_029614 [Steinernema carpocapsae]
MSTTVFPSLYIYTVHLYCTSPYFVRPLRIQFLLTCSHRPSLGGPLASLDSGRRAHFSPFFAPPCLSRRAFLHLSPLSSSLPCHI